MTNNEAREKLNDQLSKVEDKIKEVEESLKNLKEFRLKVLGGLETLDMLELAESEEINSVDT